MIYNKQTMKKLLLSLTVISTSLAANAQENIFEPLKDRQFIFDCLNICSILFVIYMLSSFILRLVKQSLEHKLKSKIIEKETSEPIVAQILQPESRNEKRKYLLQWFFIMAAIGIGFMIVSLSRPFGLHSLAIMALSIAAGFGTYYYFTRNIEK